MPSKFHLPNWTLTVDHLSWRRVSAPIEHGIHLPQVRLVIYHTAIDFDPGMRLEALQPVSCNADPQPSWIAVPCEQRLRGECLAEAG